MLSIPRLAAAFKVSFKKLYSYNYNAQERADPEAGLTRLCADLATDVINEFKNNAKCTGQDSHGDTHDNVGIN